MEDYLGLINGNRSINKDLILRSNGIKTRYYAMDRNGNPTHNNAQLTAIAVNKLFDDDFGLENVDLMTAGTSSPDNIQPSHALMVQGELGGHPMEVMSAHGTCNAGMLSLKYAWMNILSGLASTAVAAASETFSSWMHARNFEKEIDKRKEIEQNPYIAFEKDFLRWMLSDGASAMLLQDKPGNGHLSLKIDWIFIRSFANELETCMYAGCIKDENGKTVGWKELTEDERLEQSVFSLKQDARLLQGNIVQKGALLIKQILKEKQLDVSEVDYFLPHISSMFFKKQVYNSLKDQDMEIPYDKWFLNLPYVGNVGAASAFLMIEELFNSGKLEKGNKILFMVPESARFSYTFMLATVV
jgi:3-oxoacyl-[acyl-carrier-protein] synthase-3